MDFLEKSYKICIVFGLRLNVRAAASAGVLVALPLAVSFNCRPRLTNIKCANIFQMSSEGKGNTGWEVKLGLKVELGRA